MIAPDPVASNVTEEIVSFSVKVEGKSVSSVIHVTVPPPLAFIIGKLTTKSSVLPLSSSVAVKVTVVSVDVDVEGVPETTPPDKNIPAGNIASSL